MRRARMSAATVTAVVACAIAAPVASAEDGRVTGYYRIETRQVSSSNGPLGDDYVRHWTVAPACAKGRCGFTVRSRRTRRGPVYSTTRYEQTAEGRYAAARDDGLVGDCFGPDDELVLRHAYTLTYAFRLVVSQVGPKGRVVRFTGSITERQTATPEAIELGCNPTEVFGFRFAGSAG